MMEITEFIIIFFFAMGASFIQRVTGFGFGIFIMAALPHLMPSYAEATAVSGILAIIGVTITGIRLRKHVVWRNLWPILITFLAVSFFAVLVVGKVNGSILKHIIGAILILISVYFYFFSDRVHLRPTLGTQVGMGTISGLMGGLFAIQGPPAVIYFLSCSKTKEAYTSITAFYFIIGNCIMTLFRASQGFVTASVGKAVLVGFPAVIIGLWIGGRVYERMPVAILKKVVYAFMAVAGLLTLFS